MEADKMAGLASPVASDVSTLSDTPAKPSFFIVRNDVSHHNGGAITGRRVVPLIPADLFPSWIQIDGFPRELDIKQTVGMINLGNFVASNEVLSYKIVDMQGNSVEGRPCFVDYDFDEYGSGSIGSATPSSQGSEQQQQQEHGRSTSKPACVASETTVHLAHRPVVDDNEAKAQAAAQPINSPTMWRKKKQYRVGNEKKTPCIYWKKHGSCKYDLDCRFRHEPPEAAPSLEQSDVLARIMALSKTTENKHKDEDSGKKVEKKEPIEWRASTGKEIRDMRQRRSHPRGRVEHRL